MYRGTKSKKRKIVRHRKRTQKETLTLKIQKEKGQTENT